MSEPDDFYYSDGTPVDAHALHAQIDALRAEVERERGVSMEYVEQRNEALVRAERAEAEVERLKSDIRDARGLMRGMIDAKDGRVARFLIERAERFIERTADPTTAQQSEVK